MTQPVHGGAQRARDQDAAGDQGGYGVGERSALAGLDSVLDRGGGAGVGVEAIRKGEQIRVDSETRLDFQLQNPVQVTMQYPTPTNSLRTFPSGPPRFSTR